MPNIEEKLKCDRKELDEKTAAWPNSMGFEYQDDVLEPIELEVTGEIPHYLLLVSLNLFKYSSLS